MTLMNLITDCCLSMMRTCRQHWLMRTKLCLSVTVLITDSASLQDSVTDTDAHTCR